MSDSVIITFMICITVLGVFAISSINNKHK